MCFATIEINLVVIIQGPTLLPEGYYFDLIHRHDSTEGKGYSVDEWDKNVDNPDAKLYSHLSVSISYFLSRKDAIFFRNWRNTEMRMESFTCLSGIQP